jgi:hypothetical protein
MPQGLTDYFCRALRAGDEWSDVCDLPPTDVLDAAREEGVHLLVAATLKQSVQAATACPTLLATFQAALREAVATELIARRELTKVAAGLAAHGLPPLVFKGAALAFTHYPFPASRPRVDVDLLMSVDAAGRAASVFAGLGYAPVPCTSGTYVRSQVSYARIDRYGLTHIFDVHWQISIPQVFANLLSLDELAGSAVPLPALGPTTRTLDPVHALAVACIHRVAHHHGDERLIWLYDVHLLAGALRATEVERFLGIARERHVAAVCEQAVSAARERFGTALPAALIEGLRQLVSDRGQEPSAVYLRPHLRKVDVLLSDLRALPAWRPRLQLLREHVFPLAAFMRQSYGVSPRLMLPALYAWRFVEGAGGWFKRG